MAASLDTKAWVMMAWVQESLGAWLCADENCLTLWPSSFLFLKQLHFLQMDKEAQRQPNIPLGAWCTKESLASMMHMGTTVSALQYLFQQGSVQVTVKGGNTQLCGPCQLK